MAHGKRWDTDVRGTGVGDASAAAPAIRELLELARRPEWVAEEPEVHLGDHVRRAAERLGLEVAGTHTADTGSFEVSLLHDPAMTKRAVRVAAWTVIAAVAEATTHVRETSSAGEARFEVVTGTPEGSDGFTTHGHHVVLVLRPKS